MAANKEIPFGGASAFRASNGNGIIHKLRFAWMKEWIFRLAGFLFSVLSSGCGIIVASSKYWRLWEFDNEKVRLVYIGLWEAYYYQEFNISNTVTRILVHTPINSDWTMSAEFRCAQILIFLAMLIKPLVVILNAIAIRISSSKDPVPKSPILFYKCSIFFLVLSSLCTIISVTLNHIVDLYGKTTLDFPHTFPVNKVDLIKKHRTLMVPLGFLTATLSLLGVIMLLFEIRSLKARYNVNANPPSKPVDQGPEIRVLVFASCGRRLNG
ncbi:uncharacterized protein LOC127184805 [Acomys russatus]|uniref:uncharacterized protein LOC127184805 n=1 Tax=Acomys russatus TaxID=60746 RepID=UPI0021E1FFB2|nr:uncharacterized protein LOC127184805 [Acomys russatus]